MKGFLQELGKHQSLTLQPLMAPKCEMFIHSAVAVPLCEKNSLLVLHEMNAAFTQEPLLGDERRRFFLPFFFQLRSFCDAPTHSLLRT
jgi:hypothetical protein